MASDIQSDIKGVLISEEELKAEVHELGARISKEYEGKNLLLVSILKGAFVFMADLMREITIPCEIDFMAVSSYKSSTVSSGTVEIIKELSADISEYDVIIVEDILDTGRSLSVVKSMLMDRNPKSLKIYTLLDKPSRRVVDLEADYVCFTIPDEFVVGYGLDYAEKYRNLKYVGTL